MTATVFYNEGQIPMGIRFKFGRSACAVDCTGNVVFDGRCFQLESAFGGLRTAVLDAITQAFTAFVSFRELVDSYPNYRPTLYTRSADSHLERLCLTYLADQYDATQSFRGDARRAYRV